MSIASCVSGVRQRRQKCSTSAKKPWGELQKLIEHRTWFSLTFHPVMGAQRVLHAMSLCKDAKVYNEKESNQQYSHAANYRK